MTITPKAKTNQDIIPEIAITSQCLGIPEAIQRPLTTETIKFMQFNIADGSIGDRGNAMLSWLQEKAKLGYAFIGFCELVGWEHLESIVTIHENIQKIQLRASNAGYIYSHITSYISPSPYPVGIMSIYPIQVIKEYAFPQFERAILHIYLNKLDLHVVIVHLNAHNANLRHKEAMTLLQELQSYLTTNQKIVIMGDFNTLSPLDTHQHEETQFVHMIHSHQNHIMTHWKKKFLTNKGDAIDYRPMETFLKYVIVLFCISLFSY